MKILHKPPAINSSNGPDNFLSGSVSKNIFPIKIEKISKHTNKDVIALQIKRILD